jgi:hypothetical protein
LTRRANHLHNFNIASIPKPAPGNWPRAFYRAADRISRSRTEDAADRRVLARPEDRGAPGAPMRTTCWKNRRRRAEGFIPNHLADFEIVMVPGLVYYTTADRFISNETKRIRVGTRPEVGGAIGSLGEVVAMWLIESLFYEIPIGLIGYTVARLILPPLSGHRIYVQPLWSQERDLIRSAIGMTTTGE